MSCRSDSEVMLSFFMMVDKEMRCSLVAVTAYRDCNKDGTWWTLPHTNKTWSNYTTCVNMGDLEVCVIVHRPARTCTYKHMYTHALPHMYTRTHARTLALSHTRTHACTHKHTNTHPYAYTHTPHTHIRAHTYAHTRAHVRTCTCIHTRTHTHVHTRAYKHITIATTIEVLSIK